jgi:DHA1 family multidrug resistance protein-like MFS transporter
LGGFVADAFGYRTVFWLASAFLWLACFTILFGVREDFEPLPPEEREPFWKNMRSDVYYAFARSMLGLVLIVRLVLRVGRRFPNPVLPLFVAELLPGSAKLGAASGLLIAITGGAGALSAPLMGRFADRHGGRRVLLACAGLGGIALLIQGFAGTYTALWIAQVLLGLVVGGILATISAYVGRAVPQEQAGMAFGLNTTAVSLANFIGPFLGGWLAGQYSLRTPFLIGGALMLVSTIGVLQLPKQEEA